MRKLLLFVGLVLLSLSLYACGDKPLESVNINVYQETVYYGEITIDVLLNDSTYSSDDILEISNSVASQMYLKYTATIGQTETVLKINFYLDQAAFDNGTITYGYVTYQINSNDIPGISTFESHIVTE